MSIHWLNFETSVISFYLVLVPDFQVIEVDLLLPPNKDQNRNRSADHSLARGRPQNYLSVCFHFKLWGVRMEEVPWTSNMDLPFRHASCDFERQLSISPSPAFANCSVFDPLAVSLHILTFIHLSLLSPFPHKILPQNTSLLLECRQKQRGEKQFLWHLSHRYRVSNITDLRSPTGHSHPDRRTYP